jgi:DNA-binding response OmpR family regulator
MQSVCVPSSPAPEATPSEHFLQIGELCLNRFRHTASFRGKTLVLTATEYALLECLAETLGHVLGYVTIVRCTYGYTLEKAEARRLLKGHVHNLRQKIDPAYIVNVRGIGYLLLAPNQP